MASSRLLLSVCWLGFMLCYLASDLSAAETEIPPEKNLARGQFRLPSFSRDGTKLLTAWHRIGQLWDVESGRELQRFEGHEESILSICLSPDEKEMLTGAGDASEFGPRDYTVRRWHLATGELLATFQANITYVISARYAPDGTQILGVCTSYQPGIMKDSAILWDLKTGKRMFVLDDLSTLSGPDSMPDPVCFSPDGETLLGRGPRQKEIKLWDARTGKIIRTISGWKTQTGGEHEVTFWAHQFSADGKLILAAASDHAAHVWSAETGTKLKSFHGHYFRVDTVSFCFSDERILTSSEDASVRLWDVATGREEKRFVHDGIVEDAVISSDNQRILSQFFKLPDDVSTNEYHRIGILWDVETGEKLKEFDLGTRVVAPLLFTPDGKKFLTLLNAEKTALFDAQTGNVIREYD